MLFYNSLLTRTKYLDLKIDFLALSCAWLWPHVRAPCPAAHPLLVAFASHSLHAGCHATVLPATGLRFALQMWHACPCHWVHTCHLCMAVCGAAGTGLRCLVTTVQCNWSMRRLTDGCPTPGRSRGKSRLPNPQLTTCGKLRAQLALGRVLMLYKLIPLSHRTV